MEGPSWTPIFSPRFDSDEWVGIERNGGFAFAPGIMKRRGSTSSVARTRSSLPAAASDLSPGLDQIASVVQVAQERERL
jgi:hypothetical protein